MTCALCRAASCTRTSSTHAAGGQPQGVRPGATPQRPFGRLDESAEKNGCMRIKLLGDCYYCVSGMSDQSPRHADNSVLTGLAMIDIIRSVREKRNVNVDMRIGIHTGNAFGGLLGLRKWQFDIWSKDATIASHMEQGGVPGQVHITQATRDQLQDDCYDIQPGEGHLRDSYLQDQEIKTYLIKPFPPKIENENLLDTPDRDRRNNNSNNNSVRFQRQSSTQSNARANISKLQKRQSSHDLIPMSRRGAIGYSLHQYRKMVSQVNKIMENTIDKMALSKKRPVVFERRNPTSASDVQGIQQRAPLPQRARPALQALPDVHAHHLPGNHCHSCAHLVKHARVLDHIWLCAAVHYCCMCVRLDWIHLAIFKDENDIALDSSALRISRMVWKTTALRVIIWLAISSMILFCSIVGLNECLDSSFFRPPKPANNTQSNLTLDSEDADDLSCAYPWYYTLCAALAMTTTSVFLRIHFLLKLVVNGSSLAIFWYIIDVRGEELFRQQAAKLADWEEFDLPADRSHCYYLLFVLLILHVVDRQVEYVCRLDYLMKVKLKAEQEEARNMELINKILLHNILPPHVSRFYLNRQLEEDSMRVEPYHEEHCAVAVLFASIPSFADFYYEDGQNEEGLRCIQLLNEIICDFDL
ncbi:adenylate cyclase type 2, partial [Caerostris extrusa]